MPAPHALLPCLLAIALPCHAASQDRESSPLTAWRSLDVSVLVDRAGASDPETRTRAACALRERRTTQPPALAALAALLPDDTAVPVSVCQAGEDRDADGVMRTTSPGREAAGALAAAGAVALAPLTTALEHGSPIARRHAALGLGMLDDARAVVPLIRRLTDDAPLVRAQVAWALGAIDDARAVLPLSGVVADPEIAVRRHAVWALGAIGDARAVAALSRAVADTHPTVRRQAAWALGAIGDGRAAPVLTTALRDEDQKVRKHAAWALGQVGAR